MVGSLDHEMGHVAFSDFGVAEQFARKHPGCDGPLNVIEDALIERASLSRTGESRIGSVFPPGTQTPPQRLSRLITRFP